MVILSEYTSSSLAVESRTERAATYNPSTAVPEAYSKFSSYQIVVTWVERHVHAGIEEIGL